MTPFRRGRNCMWKRDYSPVGCITVEPYFDLWPRSMLPDHFVVTTWLFGLRVARKIRRFR